MSGLRNSWTKLTRQLNGTTERKLRGFLLDREKAIVEREEVVRHREAVIREYEDIIRQREAEIQRLHCVIIKQSAVIDAKLASLQRQEARLVSREAMPKAADVLAPRRRGEAPAALETFDFQAALAKWAIETERLKHLQRAAHRR
jgi:hypothetical protein